MLGITDPTTYVLGAIAIILLPGPNSLFVLSTAAKHGVRAGYRAAAGVFLGDSVLMTATALGAASVLKAYPPVFFVVKWAGAAYLTYVGVSMAVAAIRRARRRGAALEDQAVRPEEPTSSRPAADLASRTTDPASAVPQTSRGEFRRAFVISLLNPKAILFFLSFFVQFVDPTYAYPAVTFLALAAIVQSCSVLYLTSLIFGGSYLSAQFRRRRRLAAGLTTAVGAIFVGFGIRLATASLS